MTHYSFLDTLQSNVHFVKKAPYLAHTLERESEGSCNFRAQNVTNRVHFMATGLLGWTGQASQNLKSAARWCDNDSQWKDISNSSVFTSGHNPTCILKLLNNTVVCSRWPGELLTAHNVIADLSAIKSKAEQWIIWWVFQEGWIKGNWTVETFKCFTPDPRWWSLSRSLRPPGLLMPLAVVRAVVGVTWGQVYSILELLELSHEAKCEWLLDLLGGMKGQHCRWGMSKTPSSVEGWLLYK